MLAKPPYPSFNQFVLSLQTHEQTILLEDASNDPPEQYQAFYTRRGRGRSRGGRFSSNGRGFNPVANNNNFGGTSRQNNPRYTYNENQFRRRSEEEQGDKLQNREDNTNNSNCQICGKRGHTAIKCWSRFDHSIQPEEQLKEALAAMHMHEDIDPTLYADSGATKHVMSNPGKIDKLSKYYGNDSLYVGDGNSLKISHIGEGKIQTKNGSLKLMEVLIVPEIRKNLLSVG